MKKSKKTDFQYVIIDGSDGSGKCLGPNTPVLTFEGEIILAKNVKIGDLLMGPDSLPRKVLTTCSGQDMMFKIIPKKGEPWLCNESHVLTLVDSNEGKNGKIIDISVKEFLKLSKFKQRVNVLFQPDSISFNQNKDLPLDPYFFGIWLGDGDTELRSIRIHKPDTEIEETCKQIAQKFGLICKTYNYKQNCPSYVIRSAEGKKGKNPVLTILQSLCPNGKEIPLTYLIGTEEQRMELLAGLLDTDGYYYGCYEIVQKSKKLAHDIAFLARSLGFRVVIKDKWVNKVKYFRLNIMGDLEKIPLKISRKKAKPRKQIKNALRVGFSIEKIGLGDYFGFELDGDGRFLLGDFTVTHNSSVISGLKEHYQKKGYLVYTTRGIGGQVGSELERLRVLLLSNNFSKEIEEGVFALASKLNLDWVSTIAQKHAVTGQKAVVLQDRGLYSHYCYAQARGFTRNEVESIYKSHKKLTQKLNAINILLIPENLDDILARIEKRGGKKLAFNKKYENKYMQEKVVDNFVFEFAKGIGQEIDSKLILISDKKSKEQVKSEILSRI